MKKALKNLLFGKERDQKIKFGIARGLTMKIDPQAKTQRILGLDEIEIASRFKKYALWCDVFIDIGASDGYYGLIAKKYNPECLVLLFDAQKKFLPIQEHHFQINGIMKNLQLHAKYVGDKDGEQEVSLDGLLSRLDLGSRKFFIKIDVDGGELAVLKGIQKTLANLDCKLIVETHSFDLEKSCIQFLKDLGYQSKIINNAWWRIFIPEQRPLDHNRWFFAEK